MSICLRNNWNYLGDDKWNCEIYVDDISPEEISRLEKVKYILDPSSDRPIHIVDSPEGGFRLKTRCSGKLMVTAFLYFLDGKTERHFHELEVAYDPPSGTSRQKPRVASKAPKGTIRYTKLRLYKYRLKDDYTIQIDITPLIDIVADFIVLTTKGELTIKRGYAWNGPTGPTLDTKDFMRGSLVHDALYQLIRENYISMEYRNYADSLLKTICLEDGMSKFRAWYIHLAVRRFGGLSAQGARKYVDDVKIAP